MINDTDQQPASWPELARELGASLTDVLSVQAEALTLDVTASARNIMFSMMLWVCAWSLCLGALILGSLAGASYMAPRLGWPAALLIVALVNLAVGVAFMLVCRFIISPVIFDLPLSRKSLSLLRQGLEEHDHGNSDIAV